MPRVNIVFDGSSRGALAAARQTTQGIREVDKAADSAEKSATRSTVAVGKARQAWALWGTVAGGAVVLGVKRSIDAASALNEEIDKSAVVFRENAADVQAWAEGLDRSFGLSKRQALEAAGNFGTMLTTAGIATDELKDMSKTLVETAADMASFNNQDPSEMLERLRSGLAGEAEPLRRFGVLLSESRVQAEAYASGIAEAGEKLTEAQKVQARYAIILRDTAIQQGNFALTAESAANKERVAAAVRENQIAQLGQKLLPLYKRFLDLTTELVTVLTSVVLGIDRVVNALGGWRVAAGFILGGFLIVQASRAAAAIQTIRAAHAAAAAAAATHGAAEAAAANAGIAGWRRYALFLRGGLIGAAAIGGFQAAQAFHNAFDDEWIRKEKEIQERARKLWGDKIPDEIAAALKIAGPTKIEAAITAFEEQFRRAGTASGLAFGDALVESIRVKTAQAAQIAASLGPRAGAGPLATTPSLDELRQFTAPGATVGTGMGGQRVASAVNYALAQQGKPYDWGGGGGKGGATHGIAGGPHFGPGIPGFDCSGLIASAYAQVGITLPRTAAGMASAGVPIRDMSELQPGDLIVTRGGGHVVLYIGGGNVVAASSAAGQVVVQPLSVHAGSIVSMRRVVIGAPVDSSLIASAAEAATSAAGEAVGSADVGAPDVPEAPAALTPAQTRAVRARVQRVRSAIADLPRDLRGDLTRRMKEATRIFNKALVDGVFTEDERNRVAGRLDRIRESINERIDRLTEDVEGKRSALGDAFGSLADKALRIFDAKTDELLRKIRVKIAGAELGLGDETPAEARLRAFREEREADARARRRSELERRLATAETPEDRAQAQADIEELRLQEVEEGLTKEAELERRAADRAFEEERRRIEDEREAVRERFQARMREIEEGLSAEPERHDYWHGELMKLFVEHGIDYANAGLLVGSSFAAGFDEALKAVDRRIAALWESFRALARATGAADPGGLTGLFRDTGVLSAQDRQRLAKGLAPVGGFQHGGRVPGLYIGREDTVLVRATPGEEVIDRTLSGMLRDALEQGSLAGESTYVFTGNQFLGTTPDEVARNLRRMVDGARVIAYDLERR